MTSSSKGFNNMSAQTAAALAAKKSAAPSSSLRFKLGRNYTNA